MKTSAPLPFEFSFESGTPFQVNHLKSAGMEYKKLQQHQQTPKTMNRINQRTLEMQTQPT